MAASIDALIPEFQPWAHALVDFAATQRLQPRVTSTLRSHSEQVRLYREYLRGGRRYPVAPPGTSAHEFGFAMDMVVSPMSALPYLGEIWQSYGGLWGAGDEVHFQYPGFAPPAPQQEASFSVGKSIAEAADLLLGFTPGLGEVELFASLLKLGFPESEILKFLSGPVAYAYGK